MAEGGFDNEDPWLDNQIDHDGDDDDDDDEEVDKTRPFQPGTASTPYHNGEQIEMHTLPREQSGLPDTSFDETTHLLPPQKKNQTWGLVEALFPDINPQKVESFWDHKSGRIMVKIIGKKEHTTFTQLTVLLGWKG